MRPVSGPRSSALCGVRGGMRNGSPALQDQRRLILDHHLHGSGDDVADLLPRVDVPTGLDAGRDLGDHLHDLPAGYRGGPLLEDGALERGRERVGRLIGIRGGLKRHGVLLTFRRSPRPPAALPASGMGGTPGIRRITRLAYMPGLIGAP